jgi:hypothetical protein
VLFRKPRADFDIADLLDEQGEPLARFKRRMERWLRQEGFSADESKAFISHAVTAYADFLRIERTAPQQLEAVAARIANAVQSMKAGSR